MTTASGPEPRSVQDILADVAAGRVDPSEAARLLDQAQASAASAGAPAGAEGTAPGPDSPDTGVDPGQPVGETVLEAADTRTDAPEQGPTVTATTHTGAATRLRVRGLGRRLRIVGDPLVKTIAAEGPHVVRHEGDTLVVTSEGEIGASLDGFTLMRARSLRDVQESVFDIGRELTVRVNPALTVEAEVTAGSLNAERLPNLEQVRVTAGSARLRDVDGPFDLLVQAGSANVEGRFTKGRTRLRAESGSLQIFVLPDSHVRIRHDVQLGRVQWEPAGGEKAERILGSGTGALDLEVVMGAVTVREIA